MLYINSPFISYYEASEIVQILKIYDKNDKIVYKISKLKGMKELKQMAHLASWEGPWCSSSPDLFWLSFALGWGKLIFCSQSLSHIWLCDLMGSSPPGSSVHKISQERILEWVAISFSRGSSWPISGSTYVFCISRWILYRWATREAPIKWYHLHI